MSGKSPWCLQVPQRYSLPVIREKNLKLLVTEVSWKEQCLGLLQPHVATRNMGCTYSMGNCILGHCNSWDLWGHAQHGYYESKYSPQAHKEEAQKLTSACFYISLVRSMLADKWCRKVDCSRTRKSHLKVQRIIITSVKKVLTTDFFYYLNMQL